MFELLGEDKYREKYVQVNESKAFKFYPKFFYKKSG